MPLIGCDLGPLTHLEGGVLAGFLRAASARPGWVVAVTAWNECPENGPAPDAWLVRGRDRAARRGPVVTVADHGEAAVWVDDAACGRLAAEHLLHAGFRAIAYRGDAGIACSRRRLAGARAAALAAGATFRDLPPAPGLLAHWSLAAEADDHRRVLADAPRPLGLVAFTAHVGRRVLAAAPEEVPHTLAVVGCDHDPIVSAACRPSLAGVSVAPERLGARAADLMADALAGRRLPSRPVLVAPDGVIAGGSADAQAVADPVVVQALRAIDEGVVRVPDLAEACGVSRRALELRFRAALGCAPGDLVRQRRMQRALGLLAASELPVAEVGARCGWASPTRFSADVRSATGLPPQQWRAQARTGS